MGRLVLILMLICVAGTAEARPKHHHHYYRRHHTHVAIQPACADLFCLFRSSAQPVATHYGRIHWANAQPPQAAQTVSYGSFDYGRPSRFIAGHLICAVNVGVALAERGIKGTGSAAALSYLHWGRSAGGPVPGAVIVSSRRGGGHVAIVSRVVNGITYAWNATGGQRGWREIPYRHPVLDYRVPG